MFSPRYQLLVTKFKAITYSLNDVFSAASCSVVSIINSDFYGSVKYTCTAPHSRKRCKIRMLLRSGQLNTALYV